jgi:hypothetical protein
MRKISTAFLALLAAAATVPAAAEDPIITRVVIWKVKPGLESKFEEGLKRHNEFHRKLSDPQSFTTCAVESGPETGTYLRFASGRNWKDFDAEAAGDKADRADSALNTDPYIASTTVQYYRYRPEMSRPRQGEAPMYQVTFYRVKFDMTEEFIRIVRKANEAAAKGSWAGNYAWFSLVNGGDHPSFVLSAPRDKWADFNPLAKTFPAMLEETMGRDDADNVWKTFNESVTGASSEIISCRPDLAYSPAKK